MIAAFASDTSAWADPLTLDSSGTNPNSPRGTDAAWDTNPTNAVWSNIQTAAPGTAQDLPWNNAANNTAFFTNAAPTVVTIDNGNVTASGLVFEGVAPELITNNSSPQNTLTLSGKAPTITTNADATINAVIAGTYGFIKAGPQTLTLEASPSATGSNTYTGTATVAAGELNLVGSSGTLITGDLVINSNAIVQTEGANLISSNSQVTVNGTLIIGGFVPGYSGPTMGGAESLAGLTGTGQVPARH